MKNKPKNLECENTTHNANAKSFVSLFLLIAFALSVGIALLVHLFSPKISSLITADGMLTYIISCISSVATIGLAYVAYQQTERANSMAEKMTKQSNLTAKQANELSQQANELSKHVTLLEESRYKMEVRPFVLVTNWEIRKEKPEEVADKRNMVSYQVGACDGKDTASFILELTNTTQSFEVVQYKDAETILWNDGEPIKWGFSVSNQNSISIGIPSDECGKMCFYADEKFFAKIEGHCIDIQFILTNRFGDRFIEGMKLYVTRMNWERGDCMIHPQNYEVQGQSNDYKLFLE